jgi:hypothetical protein
VVAQASLEHDDPGFGGDGRHGFRRGSCLAAAHIRDPVDVLAVQIAQLHRVVVDDADRADARGGDGRDHGAAETARPDDEHACGREAALRLFTESGEDDLPREACRQIGH